MRRRSDRLAAGHGPQTLPCAHCWIVRESQKAGRQTRAVRMAPGAASVRATVQAHFMQPAFHTRGRCTGSRTDGFQTKFQRPSQVSSSCSHRTRQSTRRVGLASPCKHAHGEHTPALLDEGLARYFLPVLVPNDLARNLLVCIVISELRQASGPQPGCRAAFLPRLRHSAHSPPAQSSLDTHAH